MTVGKILRAGSKLLWHAMDAVPCLDHGVEEGVPCGPGGFWSCLVRLGVALELATETQHREAAATDSLAQRFNRMDYEGRWPTPPEQIRRPEPSDDDLKWLLDLESNGPKPPRPQPGRRRRRAVPLPAPDELDGIESCPQ